MKKTKKSQKVLIAMIVIAFFSVACAAVVYAATHFWSTYGTSGALSDGKLTKEEWNNLMTDLDGLSCKSCCPETPTCEDSCDCLSWRVEPPLNNHAIIGNKDNDYTFSNADGSHIAGYGGIMRPCEYNESCNGASGNKGWTMYKSFNKGTSLAVQFNDKCSDISKKSGIYIMSSSRWYEVSITCASDSYGTVRIVSDGFNPPRYCEKS